MAKYKGHDTGGLRESHLMTLKKDIDNNVYEEDTKVEIIDDPSAWAFNMGLLFSAANEEKLAKSIKRSTSIGKKALHWLKNDEEGQKVMSILALRSKMGVPGSTWNSWRDNNPEFAFMHEQIRELIAARVHEGGIRNKLNPVFCMFSLKNQYSEEFKDKQEVENTMTRVDVIQISGGTDDDIKKAIEENKKQLNE